MKKLIAILCFSLPCVLALAQPEISPLIANPDVFDSDEFSPQTKAAGNTFDSTFYYVLDTLEMPVLDDFTTNRFQQYDAEYTDANIKDSTLHRIWDAALTAPEPFGTSGMLDTTYKIEVDSLNDGTITFDSTALNKVDYHIFDLTSYPSANNADPLWPAYDIYDTLYISGHVEDTVFYDPADVIQDSATIFIAQDSLPGVYWTDNQAYHNYRYPYNPNSQGVATLDAVAANGIPYQLGNLGAYGLADILTSKPVNLNVPASDSVYFSFTYQSKGLGNSPEEQDSLVLEFYSPSLDHWFHIWSTPGGITDSVNNFVHIPIVAPDLLNKGFKFRFKNYASLSGGLDHWHIDYVHLRAPATAQDDVLNDLAIMYPLYTLLETYTEVPWKHYKIDPSFFMGNNSRDVPVRNNYDASKQTNPGEILIDYEGNNQLTQNVGDPLGNYSASTTYDFPFDFSSSGYAFDANVDDTSAIFDVSTVLTTPTTPELLTINDTAVLHQTFYNYYAYDDGSAEASFGISGQNAELAMRFDMPQADTLRAVRIHFAPFNEDHSDRIFFLTIWDDNNGEPGQIIYQDDFFTASQIAYDKRMNGYHYYFFENDREEYVEVPETFYVGFKHNDEELLGIGYDRNIDNYDKVFYSFGSSWTALSSDFVGTPMIRPVVSSNLNEVLGIDEKNITTNKLKTKVYPNPVKNNLRVEYPDNINDYKTIVQDISGRIIRQIDNSQRTINLSSLSRGVYLIKIEAAAGNFSETHKIVKQ